MKWMNEFTTKVQRKFSFVSYVTGYYCISLTADISWTLYSVHCTVCSVQCMGSKLAWHNYETFSFYQTHRQRQSWAMWSKLIYTISTLKTEYWCLIHSFLWSSCTLLFPTLHQNSQHSFLWNSGPRQWGQFWPLQCPIILQTIDTFWNYRHKT